MGDLQDTLFEWARTGALPARRVPAALHLAGATPDGSAWLRFLTRFAFGLGAVLVASGAIFFVAFNWHELARFAKFALVETAIFVAIAVVWRAGPESIIGKSALVAAALVTGALLALVGQVYQTGADTHELFVAWALAILPWALLGSVPALWLLWLGIVNVAVGLYFRTFPGLFGVVFGPRELIWWLFFVNTIAWAAWELLARRNVRGFDAEWAKRTVALASGACITMVTLISIVDRRSDFAIALLVAAAWYGAVWCVYRVRTTDLFVLAGAVLSVVIVITGALARWLLRNADAGAFLFIAIVVIGCTVAGAWWLKRIAAEERT